MFVVFRFLCFSPYIGIWLQYLEGFANILPFFWSLPEGQLSTSPPAAKGAYLNISWPTCRHCPHHPQVQRHAVHHQLHHFNTQWLNCNPHHISNHLVHHFKLHLLLNNFLKIDPRFGVLCHGNFWRENLRFKYKNPMESRCRITGYNKFPSWSFFDVVQLKLSLFLGLSPFIFDLFDEKKGWSTPIHNHLIITGCSAETWFSSVLEAATLAPVSSIFSSSSSQASTVTSGPIVTIC